MSSPLKNPLLRDAELKIEASLTPENRENYMKVVVSGMDAGLRGGPKSVLATLRDSKDPVSDCALGAVNMVQILRLQSQGTMPPKAMVPGAMTLMLNALDFAERAGIVKVDSEQLVRATRIFTNQIFKVLDISPQMLGKAAGMVKGVVENPEQMEMIRRRAGVVRDPGASIPVEVPVVAPRNRAERRRQRRRR